MAGQRIAFKRIRVLETVIKINDGFYSRYNGQTKRRKEYIF